MEQKRAIGPRGANAARSAVSADYLDASGLVVEPELSRFKVPHFDRQSRPSHNKNSPSKVGLFSKHSFLFAVFVAMKIRSR